MGYSAGLLRDRITILNRTEAKNGLYGIDSAGIEWESTGCVWASVEWVKGKRAMNAGALDVYATVMVRMRWTDQITMRSRIEHEGVTYQILGETFHADRRDNTIQFHAQAVIND